MKINFCSANFSKKLQFSKASEKNPRMPQDKFEKNNEISFQGKLYPEIFFINMKTYGKNYAWAEKIIELTENTAQLIKMNWDFDHILNFLAQEMKKINKKGPNGKYYGKKRDEPYGIIFGKEARGCEYIDKYIEKINTEGKRNRFTPCANKREWGQISNCTITNRDDGPHFIIDIDYGTITKENYNLVKAKEEFKKLQSNKGASLNEINRTCAVIQWLIMQQCPWWKGNDSIANVLTKSIYHSRDIAITPLKDGTGLDFEAFYRNLDDYIINYPNFFKEPPSKG